MFCEIFCYSSSYVWFLDEKLFQRNTVQTSFEILIDGFFLKFFILSNIQTRILMEWFDTSKWYYESNERFFYVRSCGNIMAKIEK